VPDEDQPELMDKISKGQFTMRIMYEQFANITKMGPMSQVRALLPARVEGFAPVRSMRQWSRGWVSP
jgi:signal recognition particle subunit SRP54